MTHTKDGGRLIADRLAEDILFETTRTNIYRASLPPTPLTWRQKARIRWYPVKAYLTHLGLAVLNRCDRENGDGYDW